MRASGSCRANARYGPVRCHILYKAVSSPVFATSIAMFFEMNLLSLPFDHTQKNSFLDCNLLTSIYAKCLLTV